MYNNFFYQAAEFFGEFNRLTKENKSLSFEVSKLNEELAAKDIKLQEYAAANNLGINECDRLRNENEELRAEMQSNADYSRWISVDEEQPLDGEYVVVKKVGSFLMFATYINGQFDQKGVEYWLRLPKE